MERILQKKSDRTCSLKRFLHQDMGLTERQISQAKFRENGIRVNGLRCRITGQLQPGDLVAVMLETAAQESGQLVPVCMALDILYEDEDLLAVNKPAGMVVHPSHGHYQDSLANGLCCYFQEKGEHVKIRPLGRLDRETSGIVIFGKNQTAAARLQEQKGRGDFRKTYLALVYGNFPGEPDPPQQFKKITAGMEKDPGSLMKMRVSEQGMRAVTWYRVLKNQENYGLVELYLETGRTHQIRVHMASIGHPLLGDQLYTGDTLPFADKINRAALHAAKCVLRQPFTHEPITITAPVPEDMSQFI